MKWKFQDTKGVESLRIPFHFLYLHIMGITQMKNFTVHSALKSELLLHVLVEEKSTTDYS